VTEPREPELPFEPANGGTPRSGEPSAAGAPPPGPKDQPVSGDNGPDDPGPEDPAPEDPDDEGSMGLLDHLTELRSVLIQSGIAIFAATILCWFWSGDLLDIMVLPIRDEGVYFTAPNEAFMTRLKLAGAMGLFVVIPFVLMKFYGFILPGLYSRERRVVTPLLVATTLLFYSGVAFAFLVIIPIATPFLLGFGTDYMEPLISVREYFSYAFRLCLAFGIVFELPLLVLFLSFIGILNPRTLLRTWRFAIVLILLMSAILTPPDILTQVMMAGPVVVLYLGSVLVSIAITSRRRKKDEEDLD
jgi:sec-independent protein translocase protein TatC